MQTEEEEAGEQSTERKEAEAKARSGPVAWERAGPSPPAARFCSLPRQRPRSAPKYASNSERRRETPSRRDCGDAKKRRRVRCLRGPCSQEAAPRHRDTGERAKARRKLYADVSRQPREVNARSRQLSWEKPDAEGTRALRAHKHHPGPPALPSKPSLEATQAPQPRCGEKARWPELGRPARTPAALGAAPQPRREPWGQPQGLRPAGDSGSVYHTWVPTAVRGGRPS